MVPIFYDAHVKAGARLPTKLSRILMENSTIDHQLQLQLESISKAKARILADFEHQRHAFVAAQTAKTLRLQSQGYEMALSMIPTPIIDEFNLDLPHRISLRDHNSVSYGEHTREKFPQITKKRVHRKRSLSEGNTHSQDASFRLPPLVKSTNVCDIPKAENPYANDQRFVRLMSCLRSSCASKTLDDALQTSGSINLLDSLAISYRDSLLN